MTAWSHSLKRSARRLVDKLPTPVQLRIRTLRSANRRFEPRPGHDPADNVGYNQQIWDWYAERWPDPAFRAEQLVHDGRSGEDPADLERLGEEWGRLDDVVQVIDHWILPHVGPTSTVGEIGTGGGRVAARVAPQVAEFHAFDVSAKMLDLVRREIEGVVPRSRFHHLPRPTLPTELTHTFDFVYSFDVFVHLDLHVQWRYVQEIARVLKPGAKAFLHTANLTSDAGWGRFSEQSGYRVEGFYFMTPQAVRTLVERAGLTVLQEHTPAPGNFYLERDHLVLLQKPAG